MAATRTTGRSTPGRGTSTRGTPGKRTAGAALQAYRVRAGLTQEELARLAAVSVAGLRDIEQGRVGAPRATTLRRLGVTLGLSAAELADLTGGPESGVRPAARVWIGVLGPLAVRVDGEELDPGSEAQRVLLGLLALSPNAPVPRERILSRVAAAGRLATDGGLAARMSRLRRRLRAPGGDTDSPSIVATTGGYALAVADDQLDLLSFAGLLRQARRLATAGDLTGAWQRYAEAVQLWRGEPLAGLSVLADDPAAVRLVRQWPAVASEYASVGLRLGHHDEAVPVLRRVVAEDPLHEVAHARLMLALAGAGRQVEALEVFDTLRRRLDRDLGTVPGPELTEAHRRVLRQEVVRVPVTAARARRTLPADLPGFAGRRAALDWLRERVPADLDTGATGPPTVLVIEGMAGVGKTRLALRFAHQLAATGRLAQHQQLYADLAARGGGEPAAPEAVLGSFLCVLGATERKEPGQSAGEDVADRSRRYRELLHGVPALVLLDDAGSEEQLAPLLPDAAYHLCLVTTRRRLDLPGAHHLRLDPLPEEEARELLAAVLGAERVAAEPGPAAALVAACGGLPLALDLAARRLQARPAWRLADLLADVDDPADRLDLFSSGDQSVRSAVATSDRALPAPVRESLRRLAGTGAAAGFTTATLAAALELPGAAAARLLDQLRDEHVVVGAGAPDRYRLHGLVGDYLREATVTAGTGEVQ